MISNYERGLDIPLHHAETLLEILRKADLTKFWVPENILPEDLSYSWSLICMKRKVE